MRGAKDDGNGGMTWEVVDKFEFQGGTELASIFEWAD